MRLYAPAVVLIFWAVVAWLGTIGHELAAVALLSLAVALGFQAVELRRRRCTRR